MTQGILLLHQGMLQMSDASDKDNVYHDSKISDFKKYLENITELLNSTEKKAKDEFTILTQLLNLLSVGLFANNLNISDDISVSEVLKGLQCFGVDEQKAAELFRNWQELFMQADKNGNIGKNDFEMFCLDLKKAVPELSEIKLNVLYQELKNAINSLDLNGKLLYESKSVAESQTSNRNKGATIVQNSNYNIKTNEDAMVISEHTKDETNRPYVNLVSSDNSELQQAASNDTKWQNTKTMTKANFNVFYNENITFVQEDLEVDTNTKVDNITRTYNPPEIFEQIVEKVNFALKGNLKQINIKLKPDYLGEVFIKIYADNEKLKAELFVKNSHVREIIEIHAADLQNQIKQQGYNVSEMKVYDMADSFEMGAFGHHSDGSGNYRNRRTRVGLNSEENKNGNSEIEQYYNLWENVSSVNYIA